MSDEESVIPQKDDSCIIRRGLFIFIYTSEMNPLHLLLLMFNMAVIPMTT